MAEGVDYGPFPIGTICLCVRGWAPVVGLECEIVATPFHYHGKYDYGAKFESKGIVLAGNWSGRHVIRLYDSGNRTQSTIAVKREKEKLEC